MRLRFDRNIMRWFDQLFENDKSVISNDKFVYELYEGTSKRNGDYSVVSLKRVASDYWKLEFLLPKSYVYTIKKNIHPLFNEYIYEEATIFGNNNIYASVNSYLVELMDYITVTRYEAFENVYYMDYSDEFFDICNRIQQGSLTEVYDGILMLVNNPENVDFTNVDGTIRLNIRYNKNLGEDLLDALIDFKKSILISEQ